MIQDGLFNQKQDCPSHDDSTAMVSGKFITLVILHEILVKRLIIAKGQNQTENLQLFT